MKQDIVIVTNAIEHFLKAHETIYRDKIDVIQFNNIKDAMVGLVLHSPAFVLLDFEMINADLLLYELSKGFFRSYPFIIVSAKFSNGAERAAMLLQGADACIDHPIDPDETLAVIKAVQRREGRIAGLNLGRLLPRIEYKGLEIDPLRRTVKKAGEQILLTAKDFDVLHVLAHHTGIVLTKEEIYQFVWGKNYRFTSSNVARSVSSLRQKIGFDSDGEDYIQTIFGVGYRFGRSE